MPGPTKEQVAEENFLRYRQAVKDLKGPGEPLSADELITHFFQQGIDAGIFSKSILHRWQLSACLDEPNYEYRGYRFIVPDRIVILPDGREKELTKTEAKTFHPLIARAPRVVGHSFFSRYMFPEKQNSTPQDLGFDSQYLRVWIFRVRDKIEDYIQGGNYALIQTVKGAGYRFKPPELHEGGGRLLHLTAAA